MEAIQEMNPSAMFGLMISWAPPNGKKYRQELIIHHPEPIIVLVYAKQEQQMV